MYVVPRTPEEWLSLPELPIPTTDRTSEAGLYFVMEVRGLLCAKSALRALGIEVRGRGSAVLPMVDVLDEVKRTVTMYRLPLDLADFINDIIDDDGVSTFDFPALLSIRQTAGQYLVSFDQPPELRDIFHGPES